MHTDKVEVRGRTYRSFELWAYKCGWKDNRALFFFSKNINICLLTTGIPYWTLTCCIYFCWNEPHLWFSEVIYLQKTHRHSVLAIKMHSHKRKYCFSLITRRKLHLIFHQIHPVFCFFYALYWTFANKCLVSTYYYFHCIDICLIIRKKVLFHNISYICTVDFDLWFQQYLK